MPPKSASDWQAVCIVTGGAKGIRVDAVAPGTIATELAAKAALTSLRPKPKS